MAGPVTAVGAEVETRTPYSATQLGRRTVAQVEEIEERVRHYARPWWRRWRRRVEAAR